MENGKGEQESRFELFLDEYPTKPTRDNYSAAVRNFLAFKYGFPLYTKHVPAEILKQQRALADSLVERYFTEPQDYYRDYRDYCAWAAERHKPKSCQMYYTIIKQFFLFNDVTFSHKEAKSIKRQVPRGGPATKDRLPQLDAVAAFLSHAGLKLVTLVLLLISSGLRIDEALRLQVGDVELVPDTEAEPVRENGTEYRKMKYGIIHVKRCRNERSRITFCSSEAATYLDRWFRVREEYIAGVLVRVEGKKNIAVPAKDRYKLVFGFGDVHARDLLKKALIDAGLRKLDPDTGRQTIHFHIFRKYFKTTCKRFIPPMYVEVWVGHQSEVNRAYEIPSMEEQIEQYLEIEPYLRVFDKSGIVLKKTRADIEETKNMVRDLQIENLTLRSQNDRTIQQIKDQVNELARTTAAMVERQKRGGS